MEREVNRFKIWGVIVLVGMGGLGVFLFFMDHSILALITLLLMLVILEGIDKRFKQVYKDIVVKRVLNSVLDEYSYRMKVGFFRNDVYATQLVAPGNIFKSEDLIKGTYRGIEFEMSDVIVQDRKRVGKRTVVVDVFRGQWVKVAVDKLAPSPLLVFHKSMKNTFSSGFHQNVMNQVEMESSLFNSIYRVFALSDHDAFYILTPDVINRLNQVTNDRVSMYHSGNIVQLAIGSQIDMMAPRLLSRANLSEEIYRYEKEIADILDVIDKVFVGGKSFKPIDRYAGI